MRLLGVLVALATASELFQPDAMATAMDQARTGDLVYLMKDLVSEKYYEEYFRIVGKGRASVNLESFKSFYLNLIDMCPFDERLKRTLRYSLSGFFDELEYTRHDKRYNKYTVRSLIDRIHVAHARTLYSRLDSNHDRKISNNEVRNNLNQFNGLAPFSRTGLFDAFVYISYIDARGLGPTLQKKEAIYQYILINAATSLKMIPEMFSQLRNRRPFTTSIVQRTGGNLNLGICYPWPAAVGNGKIECVETTPIAQLNIRQQQPVYPQWTLSVNIKLPQKNEGVILILVDGDNQPLIQLSQENGQLTVVRRRRSIGSIQNPKKWSNLWIENSANNNDQLVTSVYIDGRPVLTAVDSSPQIYTNVRVVSGRKAKGDYHHIDLESKKRVCPPGHEVDRNGFTCNDVDECRTHKHECAANSSCSNNVGSYTCTCNSGFEGNARQKCFDTDECSRHRNICGYNANCKNTFGSYDCSCQQGYAMKGTNQSPKCTDVDECRQNRYVCGKNAICENTPGSYNCSCQQGYQMKGRDIYNPQCTDIDECQRRTHQCAENSSCSNTVGGYTCTCNPGFEGIARQQCRDVNECSRYRDICGNNADCKNTFGSYQCSCKQGYAMRGDKYNPQCTDIDECQRRTHQCAENSSCSNTVGGYTCTCNSGFEGIARQQCRDINECSRHREICGNNADCKNTLGSYQCSCKHGYMMRGDIYNPRCTDIDECQQRTHQCVANSSCKNTPGSYVCLCNRGFAGNGKWQCNDVDECQAGTHQCVGNSACKNTVGSYSCKCYHGLTGDGRKQCFDIDECQTTDWCGKNANCKNSFGSYECSCQKGFTIKEGAQNQQCSDIDECWRGEHNCDQNALCQNTRGGFSCTCDAGFSGDGYTCKDINECVTGTHNCGQNEFCRNNQGSFSCECNSGYQWDGYSCKDVNECGAGTQHSKVCGINANCINSIGSYKCSCKQGYTLRVNGRARQCVDIDECRRGNHNCNQNASCQSTPGGYSCKCKDGYTGDGYICDPVDECKVGTHKCVANSTCKNTLSGYTCLCNTGYTGDGKHQCYDVDECNENNQVCGSNEDCINTIGSYHCSCQQGYRLKKFGQNQHCSDIDECWRKTHNCDQNASCQNTEGGFTCECKNDFEGDGKNCKPRYNFVNDRTTTNESPKQTTSSPSSSTPLNNFSTRATIESTTHKNSTTQPYFVSFTPTSSVRHCNNTCHVNARCERTSDGYKCKCVKNYYGDGENCDKAKPKKYVK